MRAALAALMLAVPMTVSAQDAPLTLERAIGLAMERNRELEGAQLDLASAERRVREAWGSVFPSVDLTASYTRNLAVPGSFLPAIFFDPDADPDDLVAVKFGSDNMWNMQVRAEQPLFNGAAFIGVGAAARYEALQREVVRGRAQAVVAGVKTSYYDVLLAEESVRLTENTVARIRKTLDETRKMADAGLTSSYDVLRLEVELANVEPALRRARNGAEAARRALAVRLGLDDIDGVDVAGTLTALVDSTQLIAAADVDARGLVSAATAVPGAPVVDSVAWQSYVEQALEQRSELRQLELTQHLRRAEMRAEQSQYLPRITLFGTYSINAQQSGDPVFFGASDAQRAYGRQVGVQLSLPLFSGMQRPARVAQQRIAIEQVQTQRELLVRQVENQVRTVLDQVQETRQRLAAQRFGVQQARRGYDIASAQYREGISSALELTDAEVALRQSEFNYAEAVYDYLVARARLEEAMGTTQVEVAA